ncbi:glycosyl transferase [alpha proteobacterium AAP81b]|nr:glycosyl transferase [alpha proteobacterium AAP81b]
MAAMHGFRRVAIIHYWLVGMRGGERVLERLIGLFPEADIFTHVYDPAAMSAIIRGQRVRTTFIAKLPAATRLYQSYLPLMPMALEGLDLRGYDLVISSESGPAKGVIAAPDALHLCYCHSPMRYLWDQYHVYRDAASPLQKLMMPLLFHGLRNWDVTSAARVDSFVANSEFIRQRIHRAWHREARVVHPPVAVDAFAPVAEISDSFLWVGQLVPYKRPDLAVDAFTRLGLPLTVVGSGGMEKDLKRRAGANIRFVPRLDFAGLQHAYATARALIFTAEEDFGIVPVEANASGRPVIAYGRGGVTDSIVPGRTGLFFADQSVDALVAAVEAFPAFERDFDPAAAIANAARFSPERFDAGFLEAVACAR